MSLSHYRWLLLPLCWAPMAHSGVLLEKISSPGFVMPSYAAGKNCAIRENGQLSMRYQLDDMNSSHTLTLHLSKSSINTKISEASLGVIHSEAFPVDANSVLYRAYQKQVDGSVKTVLLYEENGGSGEKKVNDSESAVALRNFIDLNCGDALR
ncbi:MAG: hypothetical protein Q7U57_08685 [Methylovulum sp.]|nr:hypothetical protein [Methylovulum sp.]